MLKVQTKIFNVGTAAKANTSSSISGEGLDSGAKKVTTRYAQTLEDVINGYPSARMHCEVDVFCNMQRYAEISTFLFAVANKVRDVLVEVEGRDNPVMPFISGSVAYTSYERREKYVLATVVTEKIKEICKNTR